MITFSEENQQKLKKFGFELDCPEENIWILDRGNVSITVAGTDNNIEAIWQDFEGKFDDICSSNMNEVLNWSKNIMGHLI